MFTIGGRTFTNQFVKNLWFFFFLIINLLFMIIILQHPGSSPQSLRQYTRSRRDGASSPAVLNALLPVQMQDANIDDVIVQVICIVQFF